jgi:hypothetical protein
MTFEIFYVYVGIYQFTFLTLSPRLNLKLEDVLLRVHVIFQMAGRARRGQNKRVPPPPPPPPTLQELMAQHYGGGDHQRHPAAATYQEFLSTCNIPKSQPRFETLTPLIPPFGFILLPNPTPRSPNHLHILKMI